MADIFAQFRKGSGEAPQYGTLAPVPAAKRAKYVQSFDERAIMQEQPPKVDAGPRGNPKRDDLPSQTAGPRRLSAYDDLTNMRADNQTLVREVPNSKKAEKNAWPSRLRIGRGDSSGEGIG